MSTGSIHAVFFSATGTTRAVVEAVCRGSGCEPGEVVELIRPLAMNIYFATKDPVVIGMPVYGGRLPAPAVERFRRLRGSDTPAVALVVYGNRAYGDALLELCDCCAQQGFRVTGAAAFVGEHSFSSPQQPIAAGRPDAEDLRSAEVFGAKLNPTGAPLDLSRLPGVRPYEKPAMPLSGAAVDSDLALCTLCGACVSSCPTGSVRLEADRVVTEPESCIWCGACVKNCSVGARHIAIPKIRETAARLFETCQTRREPEWFLA